MEKLFEFQQHTVKANACCQLSAVGYQDRRTLAVFWIRVEGFSPLGFSTTNSLSVGDVQ